MPLPLLTWRKIGERFCERKKIGETACYRKKVAVSAEYAPRENRHRRPPRRTGPLKNNERMGPPIERLTECLSSLTMKALAVLHARVCLRLVARAAARGLDPRPQSPLISSRLWLLLSSSRIAATSSGYRCVARPRACCGQKGFCQYSPLLDRYKSIHSSCASSDGSEDSILS